MSSILDLYCVKKTHTGSGALEVHTLTAASGYQTFGLHTPTTITQADALNMDFSIGNYNGEGTPDLFCLKRTNTATGKLEVHVLTASSNYQDRGTEIGTPITEADAKNFDFAIQDYNTPLAADLFCLKRTGTGTGSLEVHVLSGVSLYQTFLLHIGTPFTEAQAADFRFGLGYNWATGIPDIYCFKVQNCYSKMLEVWILNGYSKYQNFRMFWGTPISQADAANFDFALGYVQGSNTPDLYCFKKTNPGSGSLEVHVLTSASKYQAFVMHTGTPIVQADSLNFSYGLPAVQEFKWF